MVSGEDIPFKPLKDSIFLLNSFTSQIFLLMMLGYVRYAAVPTNLSIPQRLRKRSHESAIDWLPGRNVLTTLCEDRWFSRLRKRVLHISYIKTIYIYYMHTFKWNWLTSLSMKPTQIVIVIWPHRTPSHEGYLTKLYKATQDISHWYIYMYTYVY